MDKIDKWLKNSIFTKFFGQKRRTMSYYQKGVKSAESNCFVVKKHGNLGQTHVCYQKDFIFTSHGQQQCKERVVTNHTKHNSFPFFTISCIQQNCCLKNDTSRKRHAKNCLYFLLEKYFISNHLLLPFVNEHTILEVLFPSNKD